MAARILLTEDDDDIRELVQEVLLDEGYQVDAASTVAGALSHLDHGLTTCCSPMECWRDGTGLTVASKARGRKIKVMVFTGCPDALPREELDQYHFLIKPADMDEVVEAIARLIDE
jgi:DNA-binding NtrC family response regulator